MILTVWKYKSKEFLEKKGVKNKISGEFISKKGAKNALIGDFFVFALDKNGVFS